MTEENGADNNNTSESITYAWEKGDNFEFDRVLENLGGFGRYQYFLVFFVCLPPCLACAFTIYNQNFMSDMNQDYWCAPPPSLSHLNLTDKQIWQLSIPPLDQKKKTSGHSKCLQYSVNYTQLLQSHNGQPNWTANANWSTTSCQYGWRFSSLHFKRTIVEEWSLVCDKSLFNTYATTVLYLGLALGVFLFGYIMDRFGRRVAFFICFLNMMITGTASSYMPDFYAFVISRFIYGMSALAIFQIPFLVVMELVTPETRKIVGMSTFAAFDVGILLIAIVASISNHWRDLSLLSNLIFLFFILYWKVLPESPRWLLSKSRYSELKSFIHRAARNNKVTIPLDFFDRIVQAHQRSLAQISTTQINKNDSTTSFFDVMRFPVIRWQLFLCTMVWSSSAFCFIGILFLTPVLHPNPFLAFSILGAVDFVSYAILYFLLDIVGRRGFMAMGLMLCGISCFFLPHVEEKIVVALFAKASDILAFATVYLYVGEIFPTVMRGKSLAIISSFTQIAATVIPLVVELSSINQAIPLRIFATMALIGSMAAWCLPETTGICLPQSVKESEMFAKSLSWKDRLMPFVFLKGHFFWKSSPSKLNIDSRIWEREMNILSDSDSDEENVMFSVSNPTSLPRTSI